MSHNPRNATAFVATMTAAGVGSMSYGLSQTNTWHPYQALALFAIATAASRMKIKLPGLTGNMSVNLPFLLIAIAQLSLVEALAVTCASAIVQSFSKNWAVPKLEQMLFNLATMSFATTLAWKAFHAATLAHAGVASALLVSLAAATLFLGQTVPVATIINLTGGGPLRQVWISMAQLTFPYFVLSAGVASIVERKQSCGMANSAGRSARNVRGVPFVSSVLPHQHCDGETASHGGRSWKVVSTEKAQRVSALSLPTHLPVVAQFQTEPLPISRVPRTFLSRSARIQGLAFFLR